MVPMWLNLIVIGIVLSMGNTYFLEQANQMDYKLGKLKISISIFLFFYAGSSLLSSECIYPFLTKCLPNKKYAPPIGIATSMALSVLCCVIASKVETQRLHVIRDHGLLDKPDHKIPMTIFWLLPQFLLLAAVDGIANTSITSFFKNEAPKSMRVYLAYFTKAVLGFGSLANVLMVYIVGRVSERSQKPNWFQSTLAESHFDRYYLTLAGLSAANLVMFVVIAFFYNYKDLLDDDRDDDENDAFDDWENKAKYCC